MKNPSIVCRLLLYCCVAVGVLSAPNNSIAASGSVLDYMPAIMSAIGKSTTTPPPTVPPPPNNWKSHDDIDQWKGADTCLTCHVEEAEQVFSSVHYQWLGQTPYMNNGPEVQGKLDVGVNSYCINITGNWNGCGACHVGLGARPETTQTTAQLRNIDCLVCHQEEYKRKKVDGKFVPDTDNMSISIVEAAKTVHLPTRASCLQCHAKGGGGDNYKRGDMALAHANTTDRTFDVHMSTTGGDLSCQDCHTTDKHLMAGKGTDLRPTDLDVQMSCTDCHQDKGSVNGHDNRSIGNHVARVACQTCHIGTYARNADDTVASEMTETHRDWQEPHPTASGAIHPTPTMEGDLTPKYKWWNGTSNSYLLYDQVTTDPFTGNIPTSRPSGTVSDSAAKLYPFKYKTAWQPMATETNDLIALDTSVYFSTGNATAAVKSGLINMGYSDQSNVEWVTTDTYQLITHEVMPSNNALDCASCHDSKERMDLQGELGYDLKKPLASLCLDCHENKGNNRSFEWIHDKHVDDKGYDCSRCHNFSRPER